MATAVRQPEPPPAETWNAAERAAWRRPPTLKPSQWAERYRVIRHGSRRGPWRHDNAPYLRGILDITVTQGVVQANLKKAGRIGGSEAWRTLLGYWAHVDPGPVGMTLPTRDKGKLIFKGDVAPLFRRTPVLRELGGSSPRAVLNESVNLDNGFSLELMWSGSATSTASSTFQRVGNDEVDIFEPWAGDQPDAITATEGRITTYEDRRLQFNVSTPTTTAGKIHQLYEHCTVKLGFYVPCPHCGAYQVLKWANVHWMDLQCAELSLAAAKAAQTAGRLEYAIAWDDSEKTWLAAAGGAGDSPVRFVSPEALADHIAWLERLIGALKRCADRREVANVLATHQELAVWCECVHCHERIRPADKTRMLRAGRWTTAEGYVTDYWGRRHVDAETVTRWPVETKIGFAISALYCTWVHWGLLVSEWLGCQSDPAARFFFITFRLGETYESPGKKLPGQFFADKVARAPLERGIVPAWECGLLCTVDTQPDHFYAVVRAWGAGMKSQRVWHGKLTTFEDIDGLLVRQWPVEGNQFPPRRIDRLLIDSGGTLDKVLDMSRTVQVYVYAIPRQIAGVTAIKGASTPGVGLYWPMKNPMAGGGKVDLTDLQALMVDPHKANDILATFIGMGVPARPGAPVSLTEETWLLNRLPANPSAEMVAAFADYNAHMGAVHRTIDPKTKREIWAPADAHARHDYRDCEAYQIVAAYLADVHTHPADEDIVAMKRAMMAQSQPKAPDDNAAGDAWTPRPLL